MCRNIKYVHIYIYFIWAIIICVGTSGKNENEVEKKESILLER